MNEDGTLKLNRSWKVKSFTKGLELFQIIGNVAEAEGICPLFMVHSSLWALLPTLHLFTRNVWSVSLFWSIQVIIQIFILLVGTM